MKDIFTVFFLYVSFACMSQTEVVIINEGKGIEGLVMIGESKKNVKERLGNSDSFLYTKYVKSALPHPKNKRDAKSIIVTKVGRPKNLFFYNSLELYISFDKTGKVNKIYFESSKYQTSKGLKVGDSRAKFDEIYNTTSNSPTVRINQIGVSGDFECDTVKRIQIYSPY